MAFTPNIDDLEVHTIVVNGNDPRWQRIGPERYAYCNNTAHISEFPVKRGRRIVRYVLLPLSSKNGEVIAEIDRRNLVHPDRAVIETILDARKAECAQMPIAGISGIVRSDAGDNSLIGYVREDAEGRHLFLFGLDSHWYRDNRFIAVISEEQLP